MQTFLPYANFEKTAQCLDYKRLGKQRVEAWQIYQIVSGKRTKGGWINHPAVTMWRGFPNLLAYYYNDILDEWVKRGYRNNMEYIICPPSVTEPFWLGDKDFHSSHRSNLLRKYSEYYSQFDWSEDDSQEYFWPIRELKITPLVDKI